MEICCTCATALGFGSGPSSAAGGISARRRGDGSDAIATTTTTASTPTPPPPPPPYTHNKGNDLNNNSNNNDEERHEADRPRHLTCCGRTICARCVRANPRFGTYCPFCQVVTTTATATASAVAPLSSQLLLPQRLRDPPSYFRAVHVEQQGCPSTSTAPWSLAAPPPYYYGQEGDGEGEGEGSPRSDSNHKKQKPDEEEEGSGGEEAIHFLDHAHDTITSLSLRYGVPPDALRRANRLPSDHLLAGRRAVRIPIPIHSPLGSLSPHPLGDEEARARAVCVRRWQVACKVPDYEVAVLYLEGAGYDLDAAVAAYRADEDWERENPLPPGWGGNVSASARGARAGNRNGAKRFTLFGSK